MRQISFFSRLTLSLLATATIFVASHLSWAQAPIEPSKCSSVKYQVVGNLDTVRAGEIVRFEILTEDGDEITGDFDWSVSIGTIISGQGTSKIAVSTPKDALTPKPAPTPTSTANKDLHFLAMFNWRRTVPLRASAKYKSASELSDCEAIGATVRVGRETMLKNIPANVLDVVLSRTEVVQQCNSSPKETNSSSIVDIATSASDAENDVLTYSYTTNGGRILGTGAAVKWDLNGVEPGTYEIVVGVDDGCGVCGKTIKRSVTIVSCPLTR